MPRAGAEVVNAGLASTLSLRRKRTDPSRDNPGELSEATPY